MACLYLQDYIVRMDKFKKLPSDILHRQVSNLQRPSLKIIFWQFLPSFGTGRLVWILVKDNFINYD